VGGPARANAQISDRLDRQRTQDAAAAREHRAAFTGVPQPQGSRHHPERMGAGRAWSPAVRSDTRSCLSRGVPAARTRGVVRRRINVLRVSRASFEVSGACKAQASNGFRGWPGPHRAHFRRARRRIRTPARGIVPSIRTSSSRGGPAWRAGLHKSFRLAKLHQVAIGITEVATHFRSAIGWGAEELGAPLGPRGVDRFDVGNPNVEEA
jgi:hypothetical protein